MVDKLYLATMSYKNGELEVTEEDLISSSRGAIANRLLQNYIDVVTDVKNRANALASIDVVTSIIQNSTLKAIRGKQQSYREAMYELTPYFQLKRKQEFSVGKQGIGSFALNITNLALTQYAHITMDFSGLDFGFGNLDDIVGEDGIRISDWLSAMVNAHVDVAKDPYVFDLNVNSATYNFANLLIRVGKGESTFLFLAQPALKEYANRYNNAGGLYGTNLKNTREKPVSKGRLLNDVLERYDNLWKEKINQIQDEKERAEWRRRRNNLTGNNDVDWKRVFDKKLQKEALANPNSVRGLAFQVFTLLAFEKIKPYAQELSDLVKMSRIDTKKFGNTLALQRDFMNEYLKFKNQKREVSWKNTDGSIEDSLNKYFTSTFLEDKLYTATKLTQEILSTQLFTASTAFNDMINTVFGEIFGFVDISDDMHLYEKVYNTRTIQALSDAAENVIRHRMLNFYGNQAYKNAEDIETDEYSWSSAEKAAGYSGQIDFTFGGSLDTLKQELSRIFFGNPQAEDNYGKNSIFKNIALVINRLENSTQDERSGKFTGLVDTNGRIINELLNYLRPQPANERFNIPRLLLKKTNRSTSSFEKNKFISSMNFLLSHNIETIRRLARDIAIYAYYSTYNTNTSSSFFDLIPPTYRKQYDDALSLGIQDQNGITEEIMLNENGDVFDYGKECQNIVDMICRNFYQNDDIVPLFEFDRKIENKFAGKGYGEYVGMGVMSTEANGSTPMFFITTKQNRPYVKTELNGVTFLYKKRGHMVEKSNGEEVGKRWFVYMLDQKLGVHQGSLHQYELASSAFDSSIFEENRLPGGFNKNVVANQLVWWQQQSQQQVDRVYNKIKKPKHPKPTVEWVLYNGLTVQRADTLGGYQSIDGNVSSKKDNIVVQNPVEYINNNAAIVINMSENINDQIEVLGQNNQFSAEKDGISIGIVGQPDVQISDEDRQEYLNEQILLYRKDNLDATEGQISEYKQKVLQDPELDNKILSKKHKPIVSEVFAKLQAVNPNITDMYLLDDVFGKTLYSEYKNSSYDFADFPTIVSKENISVDKISEQQQRTPNKQEEEIINAASELDAKDEHSSEKQIKKEADVDEEAVGVIRKITPEMLEELRRRNTMSQPSVITQESNKKDQYYKNKEVFDGFNEIIEALGGKAMTEEEFKSSELRNQRTGLDFSAMEAAYKLYHRNGGNMLDLAPNGERSVLFQTLLDYFNGDRKLAIKAKSNVYSDEFAEWFGDWWGPLNVEESEDIKYGSISKVVDKNGEPLVVWHGNRTEDNILEFDKNKKGTQHTEREISGFWFITSKELAREEYSYDYDTKRYGEILPVYLNIKTPVIAEQNDIKTEDSPYGVPLTYSKERLNDFIRRANIEKTEETDGFILTMVDSDGSADPFYQSKQTQLVIFDSNQAKHVENLGTFNPNNPNIYHVSAEPNTVTYNLQSVDVGQFFNENDLQSLYDGNSVSVGSLVSHLIDQGLFSSYNNALAKVAEKHQVAVVFSTLPNGKPMATTEYSDGSVVIEIDPNQLQLYKTEDAAEYLLHEVVHALSVQAIRSPKTTEEQLFSTATQKVYEIFDKLLPESEYSRASIQSGGYILSDMYEFAAVFATDKNAKMMLYQKAVEEDKKGNNKVFLRLKNFINSLSRLLLNKNVFKGIKKDELALYEKNLNKFLIGRPVVKYSGNIESDFNNILSAITPRSSNNSRIGKLQQSILRREGDFIRHYVTTEETEGTTFNERLWDTRIKIIEALSTRLAAINSSQIGDEEKYNAKQIVQIQIEQFKNKNISTVAVLSSFLQQIMPQLIDDVSKVRDIKESTHEFYMYNMHDNFGTYVNILNNLDKDLGDDLFVEQLEKEFQEFATIDKLSAIKNMEDMESFIRDGAKVAQEGVNYMYNVLMNNLTRDLSVLGEEVDFANTKTLLDSLKTIGFDTESFINSLGSKDGARDPLIRSIVYLVNKAIRKSQKQTTPVATHLLKLQSELRAGESVLDLYELDENGRTTQYIVREINFGRFYNDYIKFREQLNEKYGLPKNNREAPKDQEKRKQYNIDKNRWLAAHCERRFVPKYYEAYAELSDDTLQQLSSIRGAIAQLKQKAYSNEDGFYHYEKLTKEEWTRLQGLYITKRLLGSDYTLYGDLKIEGTDQYRWAKEIQKLNETLYSDDKQIKLATEAWQKERTKIIKAAIKVNTNESGDVDMIKVNAVVTEWDKRNSKRVFKTKDGRVQIFKYIEEQVEKQVGFSKPTYDNNGDNGALYEENKKRISTTLNVFRDYNTGETNLDIMPSNVRKKIKDLEDESYKIKQNAIKSDPKLRKKAKLWDATYAKVFNEFMSSQYTSYYKKTHSSDDLELGEMDVYDDIKGSKHKRPRWATKLVVKNKKFEDGESYIDRFTELLPGDGWINSDENNDLINPVYQQYKMNVPYIPKKSLYDNSAAYNKIKKSPTLNALYTALVGDKDKGTSGYYQEANSKLYNRLYQDDYMIPGITGSIWKYMKDYGLSGSVSQATEYFKDHMGLTNQGIRQDKEFGQSIDDMLATITDMEEIVSSEDSNFGGKSTGVRSDGRRFNIIPQYYTKKLDNPSQVSSDLVGITCEYYEMASLFENKSQIKDYIESIIDAIGARRYEILNKQTGNKEVITGTSTKTFRGAEKFVEMNLYNIRSSSKKLGSLNLGKAAQNFSKLTQALNLGMSPAVALTGFFTAQYSHLINAITGDRGYSMNEWAQATGEVVSHYVQTFGGVQYASNQLSNDKVMLLTEYFDVANQRKRKFKNTNRSRFVRFLDNWCFGGLTAVDFASKSTIMTAILMGHRFMDGRFLSREDVLNKLEASTKEGEKRLLDEWKKGKVLYSIFSVKNGELIIDPEYKQAFEQVENTVYNRINKTAESADGMATETQKAAITTNFFGAAVLTHRQYLPLMIQQRFLPQVWDFDMQMYTQGQYVIGWQFFRNVCWASAWDGIKAMSVQEAITSLKDKYQLFTHDTSTEESWRISRARKKALKKILVEQAIFFGVVSPLVSLICMFADSDGEDKNLALQLAAYIARRTQWETYTPYRWDDMLNNIKSVSAQTGTLDKFDAFKNSVSQRIFPRGSLLDTLLGLSSKTPGSEEIQRGVYKGYTRLQKSLFQLTPYHNTFEQWYGAKQKRQYYEKQIMKLDD